MLEAVEVSTRDAAAEAAAWDDVVRVCRRIPPLWDLANYVAVNPFLGFAGRPIEEAAREVADGLGAHVLPGLAYYRGCWEAGDFGPEDLSRASGRRGGDLDPATLAAALGRDAGAPTRPSGPVLTFAERHDRDHGGNWEDAATRQVARWCAVHASGGGSYWGLPADGRGLYASWLEAARVDRTLEVLGLAGWRSWTAALPEAADEAASAMLAWLGVGPDRREAYLYRLLGGVFGWASFFRRQTWGRPDVDPGDLADLLAVRVCVDAAVAALAPRTGRPGAPRAAGPAVLVEDEAARLVLQEALEDGFARRLLGGLNSPAPRTPAARPAVQAVFCIDVRSEPLRRHLEVRSAAVETLGFAGFFGVPLDWRADGACGSARCPVLLEPAVTLRPPAPAPAPAWKGTVKHALGAPAAAFSFVEVLGLAYGLGLAADVLTARPVPRSGEDSAPFAVEPDGRGGGIPLPARVDLAAGILKNMGLRDTFARLVLLCGHEGRSANNPHAAGLDCGACGGHGGAINARVAAALLDDPAVRDGLEARGLAVPADTRFVAGVHDTSVDEVTLLDTDRVPATHHAELAELRRLLAEAGAATRAERAAALGVPARSPGVLARLLRRRSRDWSEVRPEWGLARNAAFIAAPRARTRGVDLQGRAFLHDYDWTLDPDDSVLTLILTAPAVVASWINLQYFASTVDNRTFGCGTKTLHNRVGTLGVVLGNGGDLRTGLPLQSVQAPDGRWFHEPLRLQLMVEAPRDRIDAVLSAHSSIGDLVENGWVRLFALETAGNGAFLRLPGGEWEPVTPVDLPASGHSERTPA